MVGSISIDMQAEIMLNHQNTCFTEVESVKLTIKLSISGVITFYLSINEGIQDVHQGFKV